MRSASALLMSVLTLAVPIIAHAQSHLGSDSAAMQSVTRLASLSSPIVVASKPFGESYVLAEMMAQLLEAHGFSVVRRPGLGATEVAFGALRQGAIDVYPEYTGTGLLAILHDTLPDSLARDPRAVYQHVAQESERRYGIRWLPPLGFQNTYAIAVRRETSDKYNIHSLSDLSREANHLVAGFTADFIGRADGLPGLERVYGLHLKAVRPLAPAVKYQALASSAVDVVDGYSTDGLLAKFDLVTLVDDRHFFPPYEAAAVVSDRLSETRMRALNRRVEVNGEGIHEVAAAALANLGLVGSVATEAPTMGHAADQSFWNYLWQRRASLGSMAMRHIMLVIIALGAAVLVAIPLGLVLERLRGAAEPTVRLLGAIQTIPSIAMLAFMIPLFGIGITPALVALWLYALYPIARNTFTGVRDADSASVEAAEALGATPWQRLLSVRLPLAAPVIMAGVRTSAVITVGAATLAAFIGAGGLGEPIVAGLALADTRMVLSGALPAAALALIVDGVLAIVERAVTPAHRRDQL